MPPHTHACSHPSLLSSLCPPLSSAALISVNPSVSLRLLDSLTHRHGHVSHFHHLPYLPSSQKPCASVKCVYVYLWQQKVVACLMQLADTVSIHSSLCLAMPQLYNPWLIRKNGLIWRWKKTLMTVKDQTSPLCLGCQQWVCHNSLRPSHISHTGDLRCSARVGQSMAAARRQHLSLHNHSHISS